jgi:hypothetical protein
VIDDTGQAATQNGELTNVEFWASAAGSIRFLLVNPSNNVVEWESSFIEVFSTGLNIYSLASPAPVRAGWELGYWTEDSGVIPYDCPTSTSYEETNDGSGLPAVGQTVPVYETGGCGSPGPEGRTYSMGADIYPANTTVSAYSSTIEWQVLNRLVTFHAMLTSQTTSQGIPGQMVTFMLNGPFAGSCVATTNSQGVATCAVVVRPGFLVYEIHSFAASYGGGIDYQAASTTGSVHS